MNDTRAAIHEAIETLSAKSLAELDLFIAFLRYKEQHIAVDQKDTTHAAEEMNSHQKRLERIRRKYPRAYEKWTEDEEQLLIDEFNEGESFKSLAQLLQRQESAVRSRLVKLGLISE